MLEITQRKETSMCTKESRRSKRMFVNDSSSSMLVSTFWGRWVDENSTPYTAVFILLLNIRSDFTKILSQPAEDKFWNPQRK